jgi:hypothetical protein
MQVADTSTSGHVFSDDAIKARERLRRKYGVGVKNWRIKD